MSKKIVLVLFLCLGKFTLFASHIVGGEFELLHVENFDYNLNLILYFDSLNGSPGARQSSLQVYVYRKADNVFMSEFRLDLFEDIDVPYSNVECDDGKLVTDRLSYNRKIFLNPDIYNHPEGYYVTWERCCRNYDITNIYSDPPLSGGIGAGQTFYLEFPPVVKNDDPFVNSSPKLFPPLRDYGCVNQYYYTDFGGQDVDGDSLVYTLVTPYSTFDTFNAVPEQNSPGPYPEVIWRPGFGLNNIVNGDPDLKISIGGLLTLIPRSTGLFVLAVQCEEFRNGERIGVMRRDFQLLVVANCVNEWPVVRAREKGESEFYVENTELFFPYTADERCIDILVNDIPVSGEDAEDVNVKVVPINFNADLEDITIDVSQNIRLQSNLDTARFEICFPRCPYFKDKPYKIGIIALDNACPQPALDTVIVTLNIEPPPNTTAYFAESRAGNRISNYSQNVVDQVNGNVNFDIRGFDAENDVVLDIQPLGFDLADVGMSFTEPVYGDREVFTNFNWDFDCSANHLDFSDGRDVIVPSGVRKEFDILLTLDDLDECLFEEPNIIKMTMGIDFPNQTKPEIFVKGKASQPFVSYTFQYGKFVNIPIKANDLDGDPIEVTSITNADIMTRYSVNFEPFSGGGNPGIESSFTLQVPCPFSFPDDSLLLEFIVEDLDECQLTNSDTVAVELRFLPPPNTAPRLSITSLNNELPVYNGDSISITIDQLADLRIRAVDDEGDSASIQLINPDDRYSYSWTDVGAVGTVTSNFRWRALCSELTIDDPTRLKYQPEFLVRDFNCHQPEGFTKKITIYIEDISAQEEKMLPPNIFTPNEGDDVNSFFGIYAYDEATDTFNSILPNDNCAGQFIRVEIYNRWGRPVFTSTDRLFRWYGEGAASGVYYYHISYTNRSYRGTVSLIY